MNSNGEQIKYININDIISDNNEFFDDEKLKNLSDNMFKNGMLDPLEAVKIGDKYKILSPEKFQVVKQNGFTIIPILIGTTDDMVKTIMPEEKKTLDFEIVELPNEPRVIETKINTIKEEIKNDTYTSNYEELNMSPFISSYTDTINKYIINEFDSDEEVKPQDHFIDNINSQIVNSYSVNKFGQYNETNTKEELPTINEDYIKVKSYLSSISNDKMRFEENETPNEYQIKIYITK